VITGRRSKAAVSGAMRGASVGTRAPSWLCEASYTVAVSDIESITQFLPVQSPSGPTSCSQASEFPYSLTAVGGIDAPSTAARLERTSTTESPSSRVTSVATMTLTTHYAP